MRSRQTEQMMLSAFLFLTSSQRVMPGRRSSGPIQTLFDARASRGRVAEWPVADPILRVLVLTQRAVAQTLNFVEMAAY